MRVRRVAVLAVLLVLSITVLAGSGTSDRRETIMGPVDAETEPGNETDPYAWRTLITVQSYGWFDNHNGEVFIVDQTGDRVWEYQPENASVFDGEVLDNGNVLVSYGENVPDAQCPARFRDTPGDHCVRNHVREVDLETKDVVWEYAWWDRFITGKEVHDADRLPNGETVIIDMGRDRTFTVDEQGRVTWEWSAVEHLGQGSAFWNTHVEGTSRESNTYRGPNQDWSHMNDVDKLPNGNVLMSIRNFDVVVEVDPDTDDVVDVFGDPGNHRIMHSQHDPQYLPEHDNLLVADSENDRIVEYDVETMERVWQYQGPSSYDRLSWPRDADRLPNGNTLIADSRNFRVLEINESGAVVWAHLLQKERGIVYDVDRIAPNGSINEEATNVTSGAALDGTSYVGGFLSTLESWLGFALPQSVGLWDLLAAAVGVGALAGLGWETARSVRE